MVLGRRLIGFVMMLALAFPAAAAATSSAPSSQLASLDAGVLLQLNEIRTLHGLTPLTTSPALDASAAEHTQEMGARGYFEHDSANGTAFWKRIEQWYTTTGCDYWSVGENLLWSSPDVDPTQAMRLWMASPEHRRNILDPRWRQVGISAVHFDAAPGTYDGRAVTIITTDFGVRR